MARGRSCCGVLCQLVILSLLAAAVQAQQSTTETSGGTSEGTMSYSEGTGSTMSWSEGTGSTMSEWTDSTGSTDGYTDGSCKYHYTLIAP